MLIRLFCSSETTTLNLSRLRLGHLFKVQKTGEFLFLFHSPCDCLLKGLMRAFLHTFATHSQDFLPRQLCSQSRPQPFQQKISSRRLKGYFTFSPSNRQTNNINSSAKAGKLKTLSPFFLIYLKVGKTARRIIM